MKEPRRISAARAYANVLWKAPLWAVPFALFFGTLFGAGPRSYIRAYELSLLFAGCVMLALTFVEQALVPRLARSARRPGASRWIPVAFGVAPILASYVAALIAHLTFAPGFLGSPRQFAINGLFALLFTLLFGGIGYALHYYRESMARARQVERVQAELARAELRALRAQVHPHFLFNTLNSIAALIPTDPRAAEEMTTRLAGVFRYALRASEREHSTLGEELAFLRDYLDIERVRFGARLRLEEDVAPGLDALPVPSLLLQPVVENAVRYGVAPRPEGGRIRLAASRRDGRLVLEVEDDGPGFRPEPAGVRSDEGGFGLHAVRERLRAYGLEDALAIDSAPGRGTRVTVTLPLHPPPTD